MDAPAPKKPTHNGFKTDPADAPLIDQLSPAHQVILRASGSYDEIGKALGIGIGTVRSRLNRARTALNKARESNVAIG